MRQVMVVSNDKPAFTSFRLQKSTYGMQALAVHIQLYFTLQIKGFSVSSPLFLFLGFASLFCAIAKDSYEIFAYSGGFK